MIEGNPIAPVYQDFLLALERQPEVKMLCLEIYQPGSYCGNRVIYHINRGQPLVFRTARQEERVVGLGSVITNRFNLHVPMFDFDQDYWTLDLSPLKDYGPVWVIESSPGHTHVVCERLVSWEEFQAMLETLPVDPLYRYWSKARRYGTVRITTGGNKPHLPTLVTKIYEKPVVDLPPYEA